MAANALDALGLSYGDDDDDDDDDDEDEPTAAPAAPTVPPAVAAAEASTRSALPDAGNLLTGLPDEVDWTTRTVGDDEPAYDAKGTRYNAVALPASMRQESSAFNDQLGKRAAGDAWRQSGAAARAAVAVGLASTPGGIGGGGGGGGVVGGGGVTTTRLPPKPTKGGSTLLPPQLRGRANVTTEDSASMRTAKRHKAAPASEK
jgi:hypothetical protein